MWWLVAVAASHFSMIGYPVAMGSPAEMAEDVTRYAENCERIQLQPTKVVCVVSDTTGAELWIGLVEKADGRKELQTFNPAFRGKGSTKIVVTAIASKPEWLPFEHRIQADFAGARTPLIFDLADPREAARFVPNASLEIDLTAFADNIWIYESTGLFPKPREKRSEVRI